MLDNEQVSIQRASFNPSYELGDVYAEMDDFLEHEETHQMESLEPGEYDLTPESWQGVFHWKLLVHSEDLATFRGQPQMEGTGLEPFFTLIPEQQNMLMVMRDGLPEGAEMPLEVIIHIAQNEDPDD